MLSIDLRLKIRHLFKKYKKIAFIVFIVWGIIFIINTYLKDYQVDVVPNTTYTPSVSIMSETSSAPKQVQTTAETMIEEYVGYCNDGNYQKAFNMLSKDCQLYAYNNDVEQFARYVLTKMITKKEYSIQNYSNYGKYYIYEIKYIDDILATGLTNQTYQYTTEKIVFKKNADGTYDMATGNFVSHDEINNVLENEYLKIDVQDRTIFYSIETYNVKFTNRTDSTVVVSDTLESNEVNLVLSGEYRERDNSDTRIILGPGESKDVALVFTKFADDRDEAQSILFSTVRVIENYSDMDLLKEQQDKAIAKFSMQIPVK